MKNDTARGDLCVATKTNYVEILNFRHFFKHIVFTSEGDKTRKEQCSVCGKNHNIVCINDNTTIKEFSYNYYIPKESGCSWSEDERYCVLVKWEDFKNDPETYIDNAFNKRKSEISKKTKVRP